MHIHKKLDIKVADNFIEKFAQKYLEQRSTTLFNYSDIGEQTLFGNLGFGTDVLQQIIKKNSVPLDKKREEGLKPAVLQDIYRSDLGELLMTYYFEEKIAEGERFIIPLKNITFRERYDMPGRGLDAIGYKQISDNKIEILLGEAKVSQDKKTPPSIVDTSSDSIFNTHTNHKNDSPVVIQRLSDYARRLNIKDAEIIGFAIICLEHKFEDKIDITYGCTLIRDFECVNEDSDFGKMKSEQINFEPGKVHFSILSFKDKTIEETVKMFYEKVQQLIS